MGYELAIQTPKLKRGDFHAYFSKRPHYHLSSHQAWYENEDTGVYFSFDYPPNQEPASSVLFKLNYFRPHFFALEAKEELAALRKHVDATTDLSAFPSAWNEGNASAYLEMMGKKKSCRYLQGRPTKELEKVWQWNYQRTARMQELPAGVYVPKLIYVTVEEELILTCLWSDASPVLLPMVERVILHRKAMAPSHVFSGRKEDSCFLPWEQVLPVVLSHRVSGHEFPAYQLPARPSSDPAPEFVRFFRQQKKTWEVLEGLEPDKVLNRELLEKAKQAL